MKKSEALNVLKLIASKWNVLPILFVAVMSMGFMSCSKDEPEETPEYPTADYTKVVISNNGVTTLQRFRVVFLNAKREILTDKDFGTLAPGESITANIPTGATEYYMATYLYSKWFFSPNYEVSIISLKLSEAEIGQWTSN